MEILDYASIAEWCVAHGAALATPRDQLPRLLDDPRLKHHARVVFAPSGPTGHEPRVADAVLNHLGSWDACLLWITAWGVWPSSEDWPRYYALRGRHGQRRSISDAPGHLIAADDTHDFRELMEQVLQNGWDATLLIAQRGRLAPRRFLISHDGWFALHSAEPVDVELPDLTTEVE